jgi:nanoRNase/pAp phosphatase (c-di-AMP/oligoRNAs hydrolase)
MEHPVSTLLAVLGKRKECYIQSHDFPDHDSIASAYGLAILLRFRGIEAKLIYEGTIQRDSLKLLMEELRIPIRHSSEQELNETDAIIIVDGCKGNKNVTDLIGDEVGVIDHHNVDTPEAVPFCDIRPGYGSCSTIIYEYYRDSGIEIPGSVATALMVGLLVDTAQMTRGVCDADVEAYPQLYRAGDTSFVNALLRNTIQQKDLGFYREALNRVRIEEGIAYCYFPEGCKQNLLGIIGDFFLSLKEVEFVCLAAKNGNKVNLSLRSENRLWNAAHIAKELLTGIGFGGGHTDMAGGIINEPARFEPRTVFPFLRERLLG